MGYSASLGIGCTIGAFFSAIPSFSLEFRVSVLLPAQVAAEGQRPFQYGLVEDARLRYRGLSLCATDPHSYVSGSATPCVTATIRLDTGCARF